MTQEDVLDWVVTHGCTVTHKKPKFFRVVNAEGQAMGIPIPKEGSVHLLPMTVCRICYMLKVPIPDYAQEAFQHYKEIQSKHGKDL